VHLDRRPRHDQPRCDLRIGEAVRCERQDVQPCRTVGSGRRYLPSRHGNRVEVRSYGSAFNEIAGVYHRHRPTYPDALLDRACEVAGLVPGAGVLEKQERGLYRFPKPASGLEPKTSSLQVVIWGVRLGSERAGSLELWGVSVRRSSTRFGGVVDPDVDPDVDPFLAMPPVVGGGSSPARLGEATLASTSIRECPLKPRGDQQ
jgi:hypothetical protein